MRLPALVQLTAVLAHEVGHVANRDMSVMALADLLSRITGLLSLVGQFLLLVSLPLWLMTAVDIPWPPILVLLLAPTLSALVQLALSRSREFEADRSAIELSGDPEGLASALEKLEYFQAGYLERLVMPGRRIPDPSLLRTHPPTRERVRRLQKLSDRERIPRPVSDWTIGQQQYPPGFLDDRLPLPPRRHVLGRWF